MGELARGSEARILSVTPLCIGNMITANSVYLTQGALEGSNVNLNRKEKELVNRRTKGRKLTALQRKEDHAVPQDLRKSVVTRRNKISGGGKVVPVYEQARQLELCFGTAEEPRTQSRGADGKEVGVRKPASSYAAPKPKYKNRWNLPATMEQVIGNLGEAFTHVASNKGAPGPNKQTISDVRDNLDKVLSKLKSELMKGTYQPGNIRRVWIPKFGGKRGLGIPDVVDRMVQEACRMVLEPIWEPVFHPNSHGFRPKKSCHTAIAQAKEYMVEGYDCVVDIDLEKFFDRVNHQRLMARLAQRVQDRRILILIGRMLKVKVVMPDGVVIPIVEGVPQGGPLSPLLSNIVLDELDWELHRRGHKFCRYADDCNIYVRSERAGKRVMESVTRFIRRKLRLKVNESKSAVGSPEERHFLGFSLRYNPLTEKVEVLLSKRTKERISAKLRELIPKKWGNTIRSCIERLNRYLRGWIGFFGICDGLARYTLNDIDSHIRRRLRAIMLKHWKRSRTIVRKLMKHGLSRGYACYGVYGGNKSTWALSGTRQLNRALNNSFWKSKGLVSLAVLWECHSHRFVVSEQLCLPLGYV